MKRTNTPLLAGKMLLIFFALGLLAACGSSRRSIGIEEGWELLAERKVNFVRDKDEIEVKSRNQFTALRFQVEERDVRISDLRIFFQNGDKLEPNVNDIITAGESSKIIELARDGRYIDRIEFKYRTTGTLLKGRANVVLLGRRYTPGY